MYARLAFSIAIQVDPEILIVDETLAVGDARFVAKCMRRISDIRDQGATILFVSHDVASVRTLCDRAIWLNKGHMVEQGDVFPITGRYMAFLFKDKQTTEDALRDEITAQRETTSSDSRAIPIQEKTSVVNVARIKYRDNCGRLPAAREELLKTIDRHGRLEPDARRMLTQLDALAAK